MMKIDNFSSLIELIATISIGFVAVEYVKSYTSILCEKIFQYVSFISKSYDECRGLLTDQDTLEHIEAVDVGGKSTIDAVEKLKVEHENLRKEIREEEEKLKKAIVEASQSKSLSSTCFYVFLSSVVLLWAASLEEQWESPIHTFLFVYCVLSAIYLLFAWILGEKDKPCTFLNFSSLRHSFICFIIVLLLSIISIPCFIDSLTGIAVFLEYEWLITIISYIVLSYLNFAVFAWKINRQAKKFREKVNTSKQTMIEKCEKIRKEVQDFLAVARVNSKLSV